jgi:hypothetical protein
MLLPAACRALAAASLTAAFGSLTTQREGGKESMWSTAKLPMGKPSHSGPPLQSLRYKRKHSRQRWRRDVELNRAKRGLRHFAFQSAAIVSADFARLGARVAGCEERRIACMQRKQSAVGLTSRASVVLPAYISKCSDSISTIRPISLNRKPEVQLFENVGVAANNSNLESKTSNNFTNCHCRRNSHGAHHGHNRA